MKMAATHAISLKTKIPSTTFFKTCTCVAEPEPHHFGGAGAVKLCGYDSAGTGSKLHVQYRWII
jgi:hypothetical protein